MFGIIAFAWSIGAGRIIWGFVLPSACLRGFFFWYLAARKTVQIDDYFLYVSAFRRVVAIPLTEISNVTESIGSRDRCVTIRFRNNTPFGRSITFTPTLVLTRDPHPIVAELLVHASPGEKPQNT